MGRDYAYSVTTQLIVFGRGPLPLLADLFTYASAGAVVRLFIRWIVGQAGTDRLVRTSKAEI